MAWCTTRSMLFGVSLHFRAAEPWILVPLRPTCQGSGWDSIGLVPCMPVHAPLPLGVSRSNTSLLEGARGIGCAGLQWPRACCA